MRIIINLTNLKIGGALQRSISFLHEIKEFGKDEYFIFYSSDVKNQINELNFSTNFIFHYFERSPASIKYRRGIIKKFKKLENKINPDIVFSFVGPAYWKPKSIHLVGFGIPHIVYSEYKTVKSLGIKSKLEMFYKKTWTKHEADFFVVQTEDVKLRLAKTLNIDQKDIFTVSNGYGTQYDKYEKKTLWPISDKIKRLLLISTYRESKNIKIIKEVIPFLLNQKFKYEFYLTIDNKIYNTVFKGYEEWVKNYGPVSSNKCPELYNSCDAMFLPTLLECFSASYPEAMKMEVPIITSDLSFATSICKDAAIYFDPYNAKDIADKIIKLFDDDSLYKTLILNGLKRLKDFDTPTIRAKKYLEICNKLIS